MKKTLAYYFCDYYDNINFKGYLTILIEHLNSESTKISAAILFGKILRIARVTEDPKGLVNHHCKLPLFNELSKDAQNYLSEMQDIFKAFENFFSDDFVKKFEDHLEKDERKEIEKMISELNALWTPFLDKIIGLNQFEEVYA